MTNWAVLGPEGDPFAEKASRILQNSGAYKCRRQGGTLYFTLNLAVYQNPLLRFSKWVGRDGPLSLLDFQDYPVGVSLGAIDQVYMDPPAFAKLSAMVERGTGFQYFEAVKHLVLGSAASQLQTTLAGTVAPEFFRRYPQGHILFVSGTDDLQKALSVLRLLGAAGTLPEFDLSLEGPPPLKLLNSIQGAAVFQPAKLLAAIFAVFLPRLYGFVADKVILGYLFLLDECIPEVREPFPRSGLEFVRAEASLLFRQRGLAAMGQQPVDTFPLVQQPFAMDEMCAFFEECLKKLTEFLTFVIDPMHFVGDVTRRWSGLGHYQVWLAFARICDELIYMLTDDTSFLRKMALFRILDQLATLATRTLSGQVGRFNDLLLPRAGTDIVAEGLRRYKGKVARHLETLLGQTRAELRTCVLGSIYIPGRYREVDQKVELPGGEVVEAQCYVKDTVRELRNTYHGYHTKNFDKYLAISTGNTPDSLPLLGVLACLALLASSLEGILWVAFKVLAITGGSTLGVFLLGLLTKRAGNLGNVYAMVVGSVITTTLLVLSETKVIALGWSWLIVIGTVLTFGLAYLLGPFAGKRGPRASKEALPQQESPESAETGKGPSS